MVLTKLRVSEELVSKYREPLRIVIPGGSGQVGRILSGAFRADGHEVIVLSRGHSNDGKIVHWDGKTLGPWVKHMDGADVVINLSGHTVNCRYNRGNKERILDSRVKSTRAVGEAIRFSARPPRVWLQASTATIYAHRFDAPNDEATGLIGGSEPDTPESWRFSIEVAQAWERAADEAMVPATRMVKMRSAMVMSPDPGGIFDVLLGLVRRGLGGCAGDGGQYVSWIHYQDFIRAIYWLIDHEHLAGAVNISSPHPLPNSVFMRALRQAWGMKIGLPATRWMLAIGAVALRTEPELILKSRRVVPGRLVEDGFTFRFPEWNAAANDLCESWRLHNRERCSFFRKNFSRDRNNRM